MADPIVDAVRRVQAKQKSSQQAWKAIESLSEQSSPSDLREVTRVVLALRDAYNEMNQRLSALEKAAKR